MSKTVLANVDGFTVILDDIVEKHGLITAAVWGVVWRYCQMKDGVCKASQQTLSEKIGLTRRTIIHHLNILVKDGYFTANVIPGIGVEYIDTGKAGMKISITAGINDLTYESPSQVNNEPVKEIHRGCEANSQGGVNLIHTRKTLKEDSLKDEEEEEKPTTTPSTFYDDLFFNTTGFMIPGSAREKVMDALNGLQLQGKANTAYLMPFLKKWNERGYKKTNCAWLYDWAATGEIPEKGNSKPAFDATREAARLQQQRDEEETRRYIEEVSRVGIPV